MGVMKVFLGDQVIKEISLEAGNEYIIGRSPDCDVHIESNLISRRHVRIYESDTGWCAETIAKYGQIKVSPTEEVSSVNFRTDTDRFWLDEYLFVFENSKQVETEVTSKNTDVSTSSDNAESSEWSQDEDETDGFEAEDSVDIDFIPDEGAFEDDFDDDEMDDESTQFVQRMSDDSVHYEPYLRIVDPQKGSDEILKLEGTKWTAGRDEDCEVVLDHTKVSREHFTIARVGNEYFITDLDSSNGTNLNGDLLNPGVKVPLDSGDRILIKDLKIFFEIRDSRFKQQLQVLQTNNEISPHTGNTNYLPGPAGAVRIPTPDRKNNPRTKIIRMLSVALIAGCLGYILLDDGTEKQTITSQKPKEGFEGLQPEQQILIQNSYKSAEKLYIEEKYELSLNELRKIHELVPEYKDSKKMENYAENAIRNLQQQEEMRLAQEQERKLRDKVERIVQNCDKKFQKSRDVDAARRCLNPAVELDPENPLAAKIVADVEVRLAQYESKEARQKRYRANVQRGVASYKKAKTLEESKKYLEAIKAYKNHVSSSYPDPKNLKKESKRSIQSIEKTIDTKVNSYISEAQTAFDAGDYKTAILTLRNALNLNNKDEKANALLLKADRELRKKAKAIYEDSVIEENLGNLSNAKERWNKIMEIDVPNGEYYIKAKTKLRKYGAI